MPVTLVMDLRASNANILTQLFGGMTNTTSGFDGGVYDPITRTLTCQLPHFSKYRAGWQSAPPRDLRATQR
ncbi:MAG: hypothetical protein U0527_13800 [Candidatus Eisenbacteria bacterium]